MSVKRIRVFETDQADPHRNLAVEETLLETAQEDELILYLWQNARTIVIGRNQNAWLECKAAEFLADGGTIARRITGGGAVYHDGGNLNFSFVAAKGNYDQARQFEVICRAVRSFGIAAEVTGRNDVTAGGRKFSGNAFYDSGRAALHHGTILIRESADAMLHYLTPDPEKLRKRSVASVASRVVNLGELCPAVSVEAMKRALVRAAEEVYGVEASQAQIGDLPEDIFREKWDRQRSEDWIFGTERRDSETYRAVTEEGIVHAQISFDGDIAADAAVFTDALEPRAAAQLREKLLGKSRKELEILGFCPFRQT